MRPRDSNAWVLRQWHTWAVEKDDHVLILLRRSVEVQLMEEKHSVVALHDL